MKMKGIGILLIGLILLASGCTPAPSVVPEPTTTPSPVSKPPNMPSLESSPTYPETASYPPLPSGQAIRPPLQLETPLPTGPQGKMSIYNLGQVILETYTPVTVTALEHSTNFYIYVRNTGDNTVTVSGPSAETVTIPAGVQHFFQLNPYPQEMAPGESAIYEFMVAEGVSEGGAGTTYPYHSAYSKAVKRLS